MEENNDKKSEAYIAFRKATYQNDLTTIEYVLNANRFPNYFINECMGIAAKKGYLNLVRYFVEQRGANVKSGGSHCLRLAAKEGHPDIVRYLIERGSDTHTYADAALQWSCINGHLEVVKILLENNISLVNRALKCACKGGQLELIKYLIDEAGANIHCDDESALRLSCCGGHFEIMKYLIEQCGANINAPVVYPIISIVSRRGMLRFVEYLIEAGADIHINNDEALRHATINRNLDIIKCLCDAGADIHAENDEALKNAIKYNYPEITEYFKSF